MFKTKHSGFSLIELLCVVAIISLIIVASTRFFSTTTASNQVTKTLQDIRAIRTAANEWLMSQPDYAGGGTSCASGSNCISMTALNNAGLLPSDIGDGVGKNAWGGDYGVSANITTSVNHPTQLVITVSSIDAKACLLLYNALQNEMLDSSASGSNAGCSVTHPPTFSAYFG